MTQMVVAGESSSGGRTVVVGMKLDSQSRELLTWALVKVAQAGDWVIALHVLDNNEIVDRDGKSSLLSLVKAFDSILAVYEGFCNLKQVDLKLKICRGSSVRKILVREANSFCATDVIVGTARNLHIRSSASVAKYCAKKLSKDCSILAVNNGKVVFHRESSSASRVSTKEPEHHRRNGLLAAIQRSLSKNNKVLNDGHQNTSAKSDLALVVSEYTESALQGKCSICSMDSVAPDNSHTGSKDDPSGDGDNSLAILPVQKLEAASSSISLLLRELPELRPGWPLLRRAFISNRKSSFNSPAGQVSVVQWAMRLPSRYFLSNENSTRKNSDSDSEKDPSSELDGETGAIVPIGNESVSTTSSADCVSRPLPEELEGFHEKFSATCRLFQYNELVSATSNFVPENMIGKGGNSQVYRGILPDGKELAVKILKPTEDALKEFALEIEIVTALNHKNIISLFGFCFEDNHLLLVYDYLSRGSLEENLHGYRKELFTFGWNKRYKVAVGVAEALSYLHNRDSQPVIHRDIKSSNILLSDDFEPQLSDFGLAKWASATSSHITCSDVAGTFGYLAPEYFMYGKVNYKIDVYAFGVVLLELLSGRKPISNDRPKGQESLVMWAKPILNSGKFVQLLDPNIGSHYDQEQVERMVLAAALCIRRAPRARPHMTLVLKLLQGDDEIHKWARLQVIPLEGSDVRQQANASEGHDALDDESFSESNLQSHLNLALLGVEEDSLSLSSIEQSVSLEDYLRGRWSRSSSFD
ncbi:probable receptor-like serine/threonine-protein kinase At5g57670 isoform X2 [Olea europaea var. sylvestris]|uniref:probable receptor-like serine/threonine-protein kinase At5g57670 isoform X1 n=1 Tax=Olea europaea var. sylvestris TaxID=158386 RepID=UPI000C1D6322|nr:probable receptor-like serine/threonine-protein kinase At5g57670 isoform X1 [Olea europaea var. sylvestris]XP_022880229.1 probable receptor-like serine/threonine-protein kinase At5g57670 isoform X2 [Olea europaea var. sylvestris]